MNTNNSKVFKLIARILSIISIFFIVTFTGLTLSTMIEVLNECSGNTIANSNQEALEWIEWNVTTPWYENTSHTDTKIAESSYEDDISAMGQEMDITSKTIKALAQIEAKTAVEETTFVTTVTEITTEPVSNEESSVEEQQTEIQVEQPIYIEEPVEEIPPQTEAQVIEEPPAPPPEEQTPVDNNTSGDESWYYETLLTHDGYETTFSYENQKILKEYCDSYGVDYELMLAVISKESGYNQYANSYCGAIGLCQVMPITITQFNWDTGIYYNDYYDVACNLHVGVYTMSLCLNKFGNMYDACTAYNQGLYSSGVGYYSAYAESALALREKIIALKS